MLEFYEKKGRKIFIWVMLGLIVVTTFAIIVGEYRAFNREVANMEAANKKSAQIALQHVKQQDKTYNGQIEYIEGDVELRKGSDAGWFSANKSDIIKVGDEIRTLADSRAILTIEDGSTVRLDENTHIIFDGQNKDITVAMEKGYVYNKVAKDGSRVYTVKTGDYEVKALGTEFSVENNDENVDVMVIESAVHITSEDDSVGEKVEEGSKVKVTGDKVTKTEITQKDLEDEFIAWNTKDENKQKDVKKDKEKNTKNHDKDKKDEEKKDKPQTKGTITLSGEKSSSGVRLHWEVSGVNTSHGFKVVKSKEANPVYPGSDYKYLSDSGVRDYKWKIDTGKKYHFRVCTYLGDGKCGVYSNDIELRTPEGKSDKKDDEDDKDTDEDSDYATSVSLKAEADGDEVKLKWTISGGEAPKGFKVVKSKDKNPVYPGDDYKYLSDSDTRKYTWKDLKEGKSYHFRVCIYKGGKCGAYSNDVKIEL